MQTYIIIALLSYLLGSIPFGYILVRLFLKQDIRQTGSGNIGATNVARSGAKGLAIATLLLDAGKGSMAVMLTAIFAAGFYDPAQHWMIFWDQPRSRLAIAALCAVLGHIFPVWLKFRGGKGVATAVGAFLFISPVGVVCALSAFALMVLLTRFISLGSIFATIVFPIVTILRFDSSISDSTVATCSLAASLLIILKHHANIRRLLAGTEPKFGAKSTIPPPQEMEKQA